MLSDADGEIYEKYADELIRFASGLVGPDDASDVLSGAVLRAFTSPSWPAVTNHRAYLYRGVLNEARMWRRTNQRRLARDDGQRPTDEWWDPEVRPDVRQAVAELDVRSRAVLFLSYWGDLPAEEIAQLLDISVSTVRRDAARAHRRLRRKFHD
jgi:RNA polymerase sigma-70 factor (ECF subfamily)